MVLGQEPRRVAIAAGHPPGSRKPVLRLSPPGLGAAEGTARTLHQASQQSVAEILALLETVLLRVVRLLLAVAALLDGATAAPLGVFFGSAANADREAPAIGDVAERRDRRA